MLQPKRVKFRKTHLPRLRGKATSGNTLQSGDTGLQALDTVWLTSRNIEAARRAITHHLRRGGKIWIRVFPDQSITAKAQESRQGGGKGAPDYWAAAIRPGRMLFEISGVENHVAREALRRASAKLPCAARIVTRDGGRP
ncbi:MAG: 50S ribosomal protein L16 [Dehalococcoidia bacterium]|jgi:large subunit ribosomal protein L16|nr:50S ribosomal protein L16 [Dehalococcoidia bacterium]MDP7240724.1 50S ribosomal protein L16 [Dehalococcoidia bacterium]MDP7470353.1 50S ribosomal protein L16 [Dehalococcoidia bacterium]